jgi:hypothetical protein
MKPAISGNPNKAGGVRVAQLDSKSSQIQINQNGGVKFNNQKGNNSEQM